MINLGITELQSINDVGYLRKTLAVEKTDKEALAYFQVFFISFNSLLNILSYSSVILQCRPGSIFSFMIGQNSISQTRHPATKFSRGAYYVVGPLVQLIPNTFLFDHNKLSCLCWYIISFDYF